MPELPDVERYKRHLDECCLGRTIRHVEVADKRLVEGLSAAEFARRLAGARIAASRRHGKHLLVRLEPAGWLTMHFGMTGALKHFAGNEPEPEHDRIRFDFADGHHLAYVNRRRLGRLGLVSDADAFIARETLGPDALDPGFDFAAFDAMLREHKKSVKSLLMDQQLIAGIGNVYSDEILFQARLHPATRTDRLDDAGRRRLFEQIKRVLRTAIERGAGSEAFFERLPESFLLPHRAAGEKCPGCGGTLAAGKFSGRTAYYCPKCRQLSH
jgi:formamidopyrimidine-DNA glycosylase